MASFTFKDQAFLASAKSSTFVPPQLGSLFLWLKPESLTLNDNDPLGVWPNSNGPAHTMTGVAGTKFRTNQQNGLPGIEFDGIDDAVTSVTPAVPATTEYTFFIVARHNSGLGNGTMLQIGNVNGYVVMKLANTRSIVHRGIASLDDGAATASTELWTGRKTAAPLTTLRVNAVNQALTNSGSAIVAPDNLITLGTFVGVGLFFSGFLFEILAYDTNIADADRDSVENYLRNKWNV
jgi:hypothetical protein